MKHGPNLSGIWLLSILAAALAAAANPFVAQALPKQGPDGDAKPAKEATMKSEGPLEIRLTVKGSALTAVLKNTSQASMPVLCENALQPSRLQIAVEGGGPIRSIDSRSIKKFDNTPYCRLFRNLGPGQEMPIASASFSKSGDVFSGSWGPFQFKAVPPGEYKVRVVWESALVRCVDEGSKKSRDIPGVWAGVVKSNEVSLSLR